MHVMRYRRQLMGFTMIEMLVAATITVVVVTSALSTFIYGLRSWHAETVKNEINIDLEGAMGRIRHDLRLSSAAQDKMSFYPVNAAEYTAISFPVSTPGADGLLQPDASGKIQWNQTVVYHVLPGSPDKLLRTVFSPRYTNATPSTLYTQLRNVVAGNNTPIPGSSEIASEQVVFENLVNLKIRPPEIKFDGYASSRTKAPTFNWGSAVLSNGNHTLKFTIEGRNINNTTGYKVGIDKFSLSPSASPREGEIYLPANTHPNSPFYTHSFSGGSVSAEDMSSDGASWSGNCQLTYAGAAISNSITFVVQNDLWCDANFDNPPGTIISNVTRKTDDTFIVSDSAHIPDIVISMDKGITWNAEGCTQDAIDSVVVPSNTTVYNIIYGGTNLSAAITMNGEQVRVLFEAGTVSNLYINNAYISRQSSGINSVEGTISPLTFGGSLSTVINAGTPAFSDWLANYVINRTNNYLIQFNVQANHLSSARGWTNDSTYLSCLDGVMTKMLIGVSALEVRYPSSGLYRSGIFDTHVVGPVYRTLSWTEVRPYPDGDIDIRVRSGNQPDLSDAGVWPTIGYFQNNTGNNIANLKRGRYIQYEALFTIDATGAPGAHTNTAILRDVTIDWTAPNNLGVVDLQVDFARGPDYGIVSATVDGLAFVKGLEIEMEIFKNSTFGTNTAVGIMEVRPLNTNK